MSAASRAISRASPGRPQAASDRGLNRAHVNLTAFSSTVFTPGRWRSRF